MKSLLWKRSYVVIFLILMCCQPKRDQAEMARELQSIDLRRGEITLCGTGQAQFGKVDFGLSCQEQVRDNFNLATALLHSFEYEAAEKVFAKVIDADPECLMAYWGVAMSNFHPLWAPPTKEELEKGSKIIRLARRQEAKSAIEKEYLEAVAALYDDWDKLDHATRLKKFESAAEKMYVQHPDDKEAAIFYALALRAASDPTDKTFTKQKKAGDILMAMFPNEPDHPGIAHYIIHTYDYPELASLALPAARKYAAIAASSAHALHMPSHIFTRLGLWDESAQSNINSISAARCYAESTGIRGHWDEELHGIDYLVYAYLQQGRDESAKAQRQQLMGMEVASLNSNKNAYTFAAVPTRYALERKDWAEAAKLELKPDNFQWENFPWERSIVSFGKVLGAVHTKDKRTAAVALAELKNNHASLLEKNKAYEANQVMIQISAAEGWIAFSEGRHQEAVTLLTTAADMEDATEKHPVTPGEVLPARELLADLYMALGSFDKALAAYASDLQRHPGRFNALYGAGQAARQAGRSEIAVEYFKQLSAQVQHREINRPSVMAGESFLVLNR